MKKALTFVFVMLSLAALSSARSAQTRARWAPAQVATIHPGVESVTGGAQCTTNFVFEDGRDVFLGQAAHCAGTEDATATNGCDSATLPLGTKVDIEGATRPGRIAYSSWTLMQQRKESNENVCVGNDFALVKLDPVDRARVNPSVPFWGGPTGLGPRTTVGERVFAYGRSGLRAGIDLLSPLRGIATAQEAGGWSHNIYFVPPAIPGDSGSGVMGSDGRAVGVLSTIEALPRVASNNAANLSLALDYMRKHTDLDAIRLVPGTESFDANRLL